MNLGLGCYRKKNDVHTSYTLTYCFYVINYYGMGEQNTFIL